MHSHSYIQNIIGYTPWNFVQGSGWGRMTEMIQVRYKYILKVLDEAHTPIYGRPLNEWEIPGLGHFEVGNFVQHMAL